MAPILSPRRFSSGINFSSRVVLPQSGLPTKAMTGGIVVIVVAGDQPGGQVMARPPRTWRWMWKTVWPPSAPLFITKR